MMTEIVLPYVFAHFVIFIDDFKTKLLIWRQVNLVFGKTLVPQALEKRLIISGILLQPLIWVQVFVALYV